MTVACLQQCDTSLPMLSPHILGCIRIKVKGYITCGARASHLALFQDKKSISSSYENHNVGINIWGHFQPWAGFIDKWDQNSFIYSLFSDFCSNFSFFIIYRHSVGLVLHFQNTLPITHLDLLESGFLFKRRIARTSILSEDRGSHLLKRIIIKHKICRFHDLNNL